MGEEARPNLFLVGTQRAASTAMWQYLGSHPAVFMAPKELHHFGADLGSFGGRRDSGHRPDRREYLALFAEAPATASFRGDASVGYVYSTEAADEIHRFDPGARIVVSFRNPVDMAHSLYSLMRHQGAEQAATFEEAFADDDEPRWAYTHYPFRWAFTYPRLVRFSEQLERYLEAFGPDQVHVIVYEDLRQDTAAEYDKVLRFLGLEQGFRPELPVVNAQPGTRSALLRRWLEHTPGPVRRAARVALPSQEARRRIAGALAARNERPMARQDLDPALRARLEETVAPEVERFGALIG
ncbi:MAG TPA: sulfotransferase, partial [Acidimicrobiales bacterium]|nr:sulfotransferase [Acidimicrobiales bacterium]